MQNNEPFSRQSGFTLLELLIVVAILSLLVALVAPKLIGRADDAKQAVARAEIHHLEAALDLYRLDNGHYPAIDQGLAALVSKPTVGEVPTNWRDGGYLKSLPLDPWQHAYLYLFPGLHGEYDILSYGADGKVGGEKYNKDIVSWIKS